MNELEENKKLYEIEICMFLLFFLILIIALLPGLRRVGLDCDSENYKIMAERVLKSNFNRASFIVNEPTFATIIYISHLLSDNVIRCVLLIYAFVSVTIKLLAFNKYSDNLFISLWVYFGLFYITYEFNTIRSAVSAGIFLLAYDDIKYKRFRNYIFKLFIATLFHYSAIILVIFYFASNKKIMKYIYPLIFIAIVCDLTGITKTVLFGIAKIMPGVIGVKLTTYVSIMDDGFFSKVSGQRFLLTLGYFVMSVIIDKTFLSKDEDICIYNNIFKISVFFFFATKAIPVLAGRVNELSTFYLTLLIPKIVSYFKKDEQELISLLLALLFVPFLLLNIKAHLFF